MPPIFEFMGLESGHICGDAPDVPLHREIVEDYRRLCGDARAAGFELTAVSGFRSYERQLEIWNAKACGDRPLLDDAGAPLDDAQLSPSEKMFAILRWTALPGTSRHHWGTDFDIYDKGGLETGERLALTVRETEAGGPFYAMYCWLEDYLSGHSAFFRPYQDDQGGVAPEPWHLSHLELSRAYMKQFDRARLLSVIQRQDICLKDEILRHFDDIVERFVLNIYVSP